MSKDRSKSTYMHSIAMRALASACVVLSVAVASGAKASNDASLKIDPSVPAGFETLAATHRTQADIYYGGVILTSAWVDYDMAHVKLDDPITVVSQIPNVKDVDKLAAHLSGRLPSNAGSLCNTRTRNTCGKLTPEVAAVMFDESTHRLDLFISHHELLIHELEREKYLPSPQTGRSSLHNLRLNMSGMGDERRHHLGSESILAYKKSRIRSRYGVSDTGASLYEISWQKDAKDIEYEVGSFRSYSGGSAFFEDLDVVGFRAASSLKTRTDVDDASATPLYLFLSERSRIDVFRGAEFIDSRFLDAGNHELDTSRYPSGAYEVTLKITGLSGNVQSQTQFFVRSIGMPPMGEPQYHLEAGTIVDNQSHATPHSMGELWVRTGSSHRLRENLSLENEASYVDQRILIQSGLFYLTSKLRLYAGAMLSTQGDLGYSLRASYTHQGLSAHVDVRQVETDPTDPYQYDEFRLLRSSFIQGSASVAFPLGHGRFYLRALFNNRELSRESGIGFAYFGPLFKRFGVRADFRLEGNYSQDRSWIRSGFTFRWFNGADSATLSPNIQSTHSKTDGNDLGLLADGRWNTRHKSERVGQYGRSLFMNHDDNRSNLGARFVSERYTGSEFEVGLQRRDSKAEMFYALNNTMTVVTSKERISLGSGRNEAGAIVIHVRGDVAGEFDVYLDGRIVGRARANIPSVISVKPYDTYRIKVRPRGSNIVDFDENEKDVTVYPGNVDTLTFKAYEITVLVGQAVGPDGGILKKAKFKNAEGLAFTDTFGWFQIEVKTRDALHLELADGSACEITLPELYVEQNLAVLDTVVCAPTQAQP